jgi:hypothetical protein
MRFWRCVQGYEVSTSFHSHLDGSASISFLTILPANGTLSAFLAQAEAGRHQIPPPPTPQLPLLPVEETPLREVLEQPAL